METEKGQAILNGRITETLKERGENNEEEKGQGTEGEKSTEYPFQGRRENTPLWVLLLLNSASEETFRDQYVFLQTELKDCCHMYSKWADYKATTFSEERSI